MTAENIERRHFFQHKLESLDEAVHAAALDLARLVVHAQTFSGEPLGRYADALGWSRASLEAARYGGGDRRLGLRLMAAVAAGDPAIVARDLRAAALHAAYLEIVRRLHTRGGIDAATYALMRRAEQRDV